MNFGNILQNEIALEKQLLIVLNTYLQPFSTGNNLFNFRCPVCLDSKTNKNKRRGYLLKKRDKPWTFFCHNCQTSMRADRWLKEYYPGNYRAYVEEILSNKKTAIIKKSTVQKIYKENVDEQNDIKFFLPITTKAKGEMVDKAIQLCKDRLIPEEIWQKWFIAVDGKYRNRIIIPFYDNNNRIAYWQGLRLKEWMNPKYLSRLGDTYNNIYNYYNVDPSKPVMITEGIIDSLFLSNAAAMTGLKIFDNKLNEFKHKYFLLDNDEAGKKNSIKLLGNEGYVFNWNRFLKDYNLPNLKDINEVVIYMKRPEGFTFEELEKYYTNSIYDKVYFLL